MREILIVAAGGSVGAVARFVVNGFAQRWFPPGGFPVGTFAVNAAGCLMIGVFMTLMVDRSLPRELQLLLVTGFLGGLTTFSAFGYETFELIHEGDVRMAFVNVIASLTAGIGAVWLGHALVRWFVR